MTLIEKRLANLEERARWVRGEPLIVYYIGNDGTEKKGTVDEMLSTVGYAWTGRCAEGSGVVGLEKLLEAMFEHSEKVWGSEDAQKDG